MAPRPWLAAVLVGVQAWNWGSEDGKTWFIESGLNADVSEQDAKKLAEFTFGVKDALANGIRAALLWEQDPVTPAWACVPDGCTVDVEEVDLHWSDGHKNFRRLGRALEEEVVAFMHVRFIVRGIVSEEEARERNVLVDELDKECTIEVCGRDLARFLTQGLSSANIDVKVIRVHPNDDHGGDGEEPQVGLITGLGVGVAVIYYAYQAMKRLATPKEDGGGPIGTAIGAAEGDGPIRDYRPSWRRG
jgi:hypothetical protein